MTGARRTSLWHCVPFFSAPTRILLGSLTAKPELEIRPLSIPNHAYQQTVCLNTQMRLGKKLPQRTGP
jgi:hypothetical protein